MPKTAIETPATASTIDRLALGMEMLRDAGPSLPGACTAQCACFDAEPLTYAHSNCSTCFCFETE
jgi:hypothetical protein